MCEGDSGFVQVCGGYWVLYKCVEDIGFLQMSGGDWVLYKYVGGEDQVLYQCVEDSKLCTSVWRILSYVPV